LSGDSQRCPHDDVVDTLQKRIKEMQEAVDTAQAIEHNCDSCQKQYEAHIVELERELDEALPWWYPETPRTAFKNDAVKAKKSDRALLSDAPKLLAQRDAANTRIVELEERVARAEHARDEAQTQAVYHSHMETSLIAVIERLRKGKQT
jgi:hypothetical protein